jgi:universal stress protein A
MEGSMKIVDVGDTPRPPANTVETGIDVGKVPATDAGSVATIVCPVDFSPHSAVALKWATAWARHFGARLMVVTVAEPLLVDAAAITYDMDLAREKVLPELREFVNRSAGTGVEIAPPKTTVLVGDPATEIVALAQRERAQLIVMATHGLTGYRKMLVGSTTEQVLRHATTPVLALPPGEVDIEWMGTDRTARGRAALAS